jgi:hypothetical protein
VDEVIKLARLQVTKKNKSLLAYKFEYLDLHSVFSTVRASFAKIRMRLIIGRYFDT